MRRHSTALFLNLQRAAQAVSGPAVAGETAPLEKLLHIAMKYARTRKAYVLLGNDAALSIEAQALMNASGTVEAALLPSMPAETSSLLPMSIVNRVLRTQQRVLLQDACAAPDFADDEYIVRTRPAAVLCQPILSRGTLDGMLYLENDSTAGAFPPDAVDIAELLAAMVAISMKTAQLHRRLQRDDKERRLTERALRDGEMRIRRLMESNIIGICFWTLEGDIVDANDAFLRIVGHGREALLAGNINWIDMTPPEFREIQERAIAELMCSGSCTPYEKEYIALDGRRVPVLIGGALFEGSRECGVSFVLDLTERKNAEQALVKSEERFRSLTRLSSDWYWEQDEHCRFTLLSGGIFENGMADARHFLGKTRWEMPIRVDPAMWADYRARVAAHQPFMDMEYQILGKDGKPQWNSFSGVPLFDRDGTFTGYRGTGKVITARKLAEQALRDSEERFRSLAKMSSDWYWEQDAQFRFTMLSGGIFEKGGTRPESLVGKTRWELPLDLAPEALAAHKATQEAHLPFSDLEYRTRGDDGRAYWYSISGEPLFDAQGVFKGYRGTGKNITDRKQAEALREGQSRILEMMAAGSPLEEVLGNLVLVIEAQSDGMVGGIMLLTDDGQRVKSALAPKLPPAFVGQIVGLQVENLSGSCGNAVRRGEPVIVTDILNDPLWDGCRHLVEPQGLRACWATPIMSRQGRVLGAFAMYYRKVRSPEAAERHLAEIATRIAGIAIERQQTEERIRHMAHHDALTGLPNRTLLVERVAQMIAEARRSDSLVGLLFIDLDHFKHINDSLGHSIGDALLKAASVRLQGCLRKGDSIARLGGDEFVISLPALNGGEDAAAVAVKVLETLQLPFLVEGHELHAEASIGISLYPQDGEDADTLMRAADTAMYHAKDKGRGRYQFFMPNLTAAAQRRLELANQLRHALGRGEFLLHFQPQIDMESGAILAAEALIRWRRPDGSYVSPAEFIPIAEDTGMIVPIGDWVLREACAQLKRWRDGGGPELGIAVNLSARQVMHPGLLQTVAQILNEYELPAGLLDLEITESILMHPSDENLIPLTALSEMGVQLSVDDFGTGYSSLSYLKRFPIDALKIDQSFVRGIGSDLNDMAIINAIIAMAQSLNLKVIAEGVETAAQAAFLVKHGCLEAQGYYFSRPVPADDFAALLQKQGICPAGPESGQPLCQAARPRNPG